MPRWFKLTIAIAFFVAMTIQLLEPALGLISGLLLGLVCFVAGAGEIGIRLYDRRDSRIDEPTTLNLTGK